MDPIIWLEIFLALACLYILDRNLFHYVDLLLQTCITQLRLQIHQRVFGIRLWLDRQALNRKGPVGRLWNEYSLWQIRNNPAYKEFFTKKDEQV